MGGFWHYLFDHPGEQIWTWTRTTLWLGAVPVVIGLLIALPIGWLAYRYKWTYPPVVSFAGLLYTIPSLVLFLVMPGILGTGILDPVNVAVALTLYTVALLVRVVADGLSAVSPETLAAATAMGFTGWQRLVKVQLPLAVPVIGAGLRVAAVSNVSLISVSSVIGVTQLGQLFTDAFGKVTIAQQVRPALLGIILFFVIALAYDLIILIGMRLLAMAAGGALMSGVLADSGVSFNGVGKYLTTGTNWWGADGLIEHIRDHLIYSAIIVVLAVVIALPIGLAVGHSGRGVVAIVGVANALRAVPTLGLAVLLYVWLAPKIPVNRHQVLFLIRGGVPTFIVVVIGLVVLAIPPILTNTYAGIQAVDPAARDAARGMGMSGWQVLWRVEVPCALPLMMSGLRSATLQVIATVTVAAYLPALGGLGTYIVAGAQQGPSGYPAMVTAALLLAILAVVIDALLNIVQRLVVSPGISGRYSSRPGVTSAPLVEAQLTAA